MNDKALKTLEYYKIIDQLEKFAGSEMARTRCHTLTPMTDLESINTALSQTNDALSRSLAHSAPGFGGFKDFTACIRRLEVGSSLNTAELLNISSMLNTAARAITYAGHRETPDTLTPMFENLDALNNLNTELKRCIISEDEISDDASRTLKDIRRQISASGEKIHTELNRMVNSQSMRTYLQEYVITSRGGRYCLPVKAEYKSNVPGMVHDQSATGSTLFIEPMAVVKLNNDLKELALKEEAEIEAILAALSANAAQYTSELQNDQETLVTLDFIFAKAALSRHYNGSCPIMNENGYINIKKGRHPLIEPHQVVPIDIYLGKEFDLLVITGPNTGGKTVSLKTVGLLTLMGQSGLNIPAFDNSELAVFKKVYADIGDEQSIEQSLSTFSSHMTNTIKIIKYADKRSLILFDEIGAGTDPTEGAALATAILANLHKRGIRTIATTHYSEIKVFALSTPGVENACCEFDVESLRPTYRLLIGVPGKSNAFAISSKLGLPDFIIKDAAERIEQEDIQFEDVLTDLETSRVSLENERAEVNNLKKEVDQLKVQLKQEQEKFAAQREKILNKANQEAAEILKDAKEYADETIRTMNKHGMTLQELERTRSEARERMSRAKNKISAKDTVAPSPARQYKPEEFTLGTKVKVLSLNLTGTVSTRPDSRGNLFVQMGIIRSKLNISDLEIIEEDAFGNKVDKHTKKTGSAIGGAGKIKMSKSSSISPEINLLGHTVDEAIAKLDKYLDDAYLSGLSQVRVVHGNGTGALRSGIASYLRGLPNVSTFRLGEPGEGGAGVTIVDFK